MKCITGKYVWLLVVSCWLLTACSSDSTNEQQTGSILQVMPYVAAYQSHDALARRAWSDGYLPYNPDHDISIGLYILPDPDDENPPTTKLIRFNNGVWHSQAMVKQAEYEIYGYMPKSIESNISQNKSEGTAELTLKGIDAVMAEDVCFVTGVKDMTGDLWQGKFVYVGQSDNNMVRLLMDHLFAAVNIQFSVDADYSKLRTIKLKKMTLNSLTTGKMNAVIKLKSNETGADPVTSVTYNTPTEGSTSATFFENTSGITLNEEGVSTISKSYCYFAPSLGNDIDNLTLVCAYDVYDRKGNKIRECEATNKLPNLGSVRGERVTIKLNVAPTYLGQLSEQDLDDPDLTITN